MAAARPSLKGMPIVIEGYPVLTTSRKRKRFLGRHVIVMLLFAASIRPFWVLAAETPEEFYRDSTISWIVPYKPGGGYDAYSRLLVPYIEKYSGARVRILNRPGAGGIKGHRQLYRSSSDGLTIGIVNGPTLVLRALDEKQELDIEIERLNFLGRIVSEQRVLVVASNSPIQTLEQILEGEQEFLMGATAVGSGSYIDARVVGDALKLRQKVIHGFNSSSDARLALLRGDVYGMWSSHTSAMKGVRNAQEKIVLQLGPHRHASMPAIPATGELLNSPGEGADGAKLVDIWHALNEVGRVIVAPPDVDESKLAFLRQVVESSIKDEEFVQLAAESRRDLAFLPSHELQQLVESFAGLETNLRFELLSLARSE